MPARRLTLPPRAYDVVQYALGYPFTQRRLRQRVRAWSGLSVLDVGGGTGNLATVLPSPARYVCVDSDPAKLERCGRRFPSAEVVVADATSLPFDDAGFDCTAFVAVAHHLEDDALERAVGELARVTRRELLFLDPLASTAPSSRLLWALDAGAHPRSRQRLMEVLGGYFDLVDAERFRLVHAYLLCTARPHA